MVQIYNQVLEIDLRILILAISLIEKNNIKVIKKSSFYESTSFPNPKYPKFINIVIEVSTLLKPIDLMKILLKIEKDLERERKNKNDPRTCDIDIIDYKNESINLKIEKITIKNTSYIYERKRFCFYCH